MGISQHAWSRVVINFRLTTVSDHLVRVFETGATDERTPLLEDSSPIVVCLQRRPADIREKLFLGIESGHEFSWSIPFQTIKTKHFILELVGESRCALLSFPDVSALLDADRNPLSRNQIKKQFSRRLTSILM